MREKNSLVYRAREGPSAVVPLGNPWSRRALVPSALALDHRARPGRPVVFVNTGGGEQYVEQRPRSAHILPCCGVLCVGRTGSERWRGTEVLMPRPDSVPGR